MSLFQVKLLTKCTIIKPYVLNFFCLFMCIFTFVSFCLQYIYCWAHLDNFCCPLFHTCIEEIEFNEDNFLQLDLLLVTNPCFQARSYFSMPDKFSEKTLLVRQWHLLTATNYYQDKERDTHVHIHTNTYMY